MSFDSRAHDLSHGIGGDEEKRRGEDDPCWPVQWQKCCPDLPPTSNGLRYTDLSGANVVSPRPPRP
jgi:hypothetical protein